jgi:hypothetical protein
LKWEEELWGLLLLLFCQSLEGAVSIAAAFETLGKLTKFIYLNLDLTDNAIGMGVIALQKLKKKDSL